MGGIYVQQDTYQVVYTEYLVSYDVWYLLRCTSHLFSMCATDVYLVAGVMNRAYVS